MRHKKENRFQFTNFSDRISQINVDIIRRFNRAEGSIEDTESFFHVALEKWSDLDCSSDFSDFKREVKSHQLQTLPQILLFKNEIVGCLKNHLSKPDSLCVSTLLELTIALSRDLQHDFYPFFWDFYVIFLSLLEKNELNPEFLDLLFTAIAYLLKFLWKSLTLEMKKAFKKFIPLFGHRKHYIRQFASEAFAFLLRKTKKLMKFVEFCLKAVEKDSSLMDGVSQLLFQSIRGVRRQFHSTSTIVYEQLLCLMHPKKCIGFQSTTVVSLLEKQTELMTKFADIDSAKTMMEVVMSLTVKSSKIKAADDASFFCALVKIFRVWVDYKNGYFVKDPSAWLETLGDSVPAVSVDGEAHSELLRGITCLVRAKESAISAIQLKSLCETISQPHYKSKENVFIFFDSLLDLNLFDLTVRPIYITFVWSQLLDGSKNFDSLSILALTKLISRKRPIFPQGDDVETGFLWQSWKKYSVYSTEASTDSLEKFVSANLESINVDNLHLLKTALLIIPHLREPKVVLKPFKKLFDSIFAEKFEEIPPPEHELIIYLCLTTSILVVHQEVFSWLSTDAFLTILKKKPESLLILSAADLFFGFSQHSQMGTVLREQVFDDLVGILAPNLMCPSHSIRILSSRILSYFPVTLGPAEGHEQIPLFELCTRVEAVPVTMEDYRERIRLMRKLTFQEVHHHMPAPTDKFETIPLRFLIGQLHVNFTLLWPHIIDFVASHAKGMKSEQFWEIFTAQLELAAKQARISDEDFEAEITADDSVNCVKTLESFWSFNQNELSKKFNDKRADYVSFRILLWKCIGGFADVAEKRSRNFTHLFLDFMNSEVTTISRVENLEIIDEKVPEEKPIEVEDVEETDIEESVTEKEKRKGSATEKTLLAMLDAFGKFHNPRALVMEPKIFAVYMELLLRSSGKIQNAVMKCIFAYKLKFLAPYQEHLERILNEKTMKDELVLFSLSPEVSIVDTTHREEILKILLRILYGKIYCRTFGSGSHDLQLRRNMIFRFLAGCSSDELKSFIDLLFEPVKIYMKAESSLSEMKLFIDENYDLRTSVPLRKLQGLLMMLSLVYKRLGQGVVDMLPYLLRVLLTVSTIVKVIWEKKTLVSPRYFGMLKTLRNLIVARLVEFFTIFDNYPYSEEEISLIFKAIVEPLISNYSDSGCQSPTGLTKLFVCWSQNPRYFCLFNVPVADGLTPIKAVMNLLLNQNCQPLVQSAVLDMVLSLLSMADFSPAEDNCISLSCGQAPIAQLSRVVMSELNLGTKILLNCIPQFLQYLESKALVTDKKSPTSKDLEILVKLCEFVDQAEESHKLIQLLLPYLVNNRIKHESSLVNALRSVKLLMEFAEKSAEFLDQLAPLFQLVRSRPARAALCDILKVLGDRNSECSQFVDIVVRLNCWDPKRVEEPDYKARLSAHKELNHLMDMSENKLDQRFARLVLNNLAFAMANNEDMSLRDSASNSLLLLMRRIAADTTDDAKTRNSFVTKQIIPVVKTGLKSEMEVVRHEFLILLKNCLLLFPDCPRFGNLHTLLSNEDAELDFFENMRNIQLYRRTRAIRRLCESLKLQCESPIEHPISWEALLSFVVPLIRPFLFDVIYSKNSALLDESAKFLGVVAQLMPWPRYKLMLEYYLTRMQKDLEHQRYIVKVVVAILDGFHFYETSIATVEPKSIDSDEPDEMPDIDEDNITESQVTSGLETSQKIYDSVVTYLIPKLSQCLQRKNSTVGAQKINPDGTKVYEEDEEILRIPVALAMVKLLQKTSKQLLNSHLPSILLKICTLLKSRSQDIRDSTRKTLLAIMKTLGPEYLTYFVKEIKGVLLRGYQVHVRNFCVNSVLSELANQLHSGDLDPSVKDIIEICNEELFGSVADEKEISELTKNLSEARGSKTIETYEIIGKFCSQEQLRFVLESLKEILNNQQNHKTVKKVGDVCRHLAQGLALNDGLSIEGCLIFIHHVLSENMPTLFVDKGKVESDTAKDSIDSKKVDSYVLMPEPGRSGAAPVHSKKSTIHVLIEFAFQELLSLMKQNKLVATDETHAGLLDPFVALVLQGIQSAFPKVIGLCLRCFASFSKFPLPSMKSSYKVFVDRFFVLLNQYGSIGAAAKGDTMELILRLFKAVTCVVREGLQYNISTKQLKVLLQYAEQDIFDLNRQACAFSLIRAILSRKLLSEDIHTLLAKVRELAIVSPIEHVRLQCRQIYLQYLLDYPIGKGVRKHLEFCLTQLGYELEDGRISNLLIIESVINNVNQEVLHEFCALMFLNMGVQLINDTSAKCKKLVAQCIRLLLTKIEMPKRDLLFQMTTSWLHNKEAAQKQLSVQLCAIFADVEGEKFERRLSALLPEWVKVIETAACQYSFQLTETEEDETRCDQFLLQFLTAFMGICRKCSGAIRSVEFAEGFSKIWNFCQKCLTHPQRLIRLSSSQCFGVLFGNYKAEEIDSTTTVQTKEFLLENSRETVAALCGSFCSQLWFHPLQMDIGEQAIKNLVFLSRVLRLNLWKQDPKKEELGSKENEEKRLFSLDSVAKELAKLCRIEMVKNPKITVKRLNVFKWFAALGMDSPVEVSENLAGIILPHLHRELTVGDGDPDLRVLAGEVCEIFKGKIGLDIFTKLYSECQVKAAAKREVRKREAAAEAVSDPQTFAAKKIRRHQSKVESRKRKIAALKPYKAASKRKRSQEESEEV